MTKPSQIQIQLPVSSFFTLHGSRLLPSPTGSIPLVVTAMCCLYISTPICTSSGTRVTYVTSLIAARADLRQIVVHVDLQLAYALRYEMPRLHLYT